MPVAPRPQRATTSGLLAVSPDSRTIAVASGGELMLHAADDLAVTERAPAPPDLRALGFVGAAPQLLLVSADALYTLDLPSLLVTARCDLPPDTTLAAITGDRVVLAAAGGLGIARCTGAAIILEELRTPSAVDLIVGLDRDRLLVAMRDRTEILAAHSQRTVAQLAAPLPPAPRIGGLAGQHRVVWIARSGHRELVLLRLSDGRTFNYRAPTPIDAVWSHPDSPWLVAARADGTERVHVLTLAGHGLPVVPLRGAAVGGGPDPCLYHLDVTDRLRATPLSGDATAPGRGLRLHMTRDPDAR